MLADILKNLEVEYRLLREKEAAALGGVTRRAFVDCLFDTFLAREDVFSAFAYCGQKSRDRGSIVLEYGRTDGYNSPPYQYGEAADHQFVVCYKNPKYWEWSLLLLRRKADAVVGPYQIKDSYGHPTARISGDSIPVTGLLRFSSGIERRPMKAEEVTRDALADPDVRIKSEFPSPDKKLSLFDEFYRGMEQLSELCVEGMRRQVDLLPGKREQSASIEKVYRVLCAFVGNT